MKVINPDGSLEEGGLSIGIDVFLLGVAVVSTIYFAEKHRAKKRRQKIYEETGDWM